MLVLQFLLWKILIKVNNIFDKIKRNSLPTYPNFLSGGDKKHQKNNCRIYPVIVLTFEHYSILSVKHVSNCCTPIIDCLVFLTFWGKIYLDTDIYICCKSFFIVGKADYLWKGSVGNNLDYFIIFEFSDISQSIHKDRIWQSVM